MLAASRTRTRLSSAQVCSDIPPTSQPLSYAAVMAARSLAVFAKAESAIATFSAGSRWSRRGSDRAVDTVAGNIDVAFAPTAGRYVGYPRSCCCWTSER